MGRSKAIDTAGHLWVEEGEQREGVIAEVAPLIPSRRTYSFAVPESMEDALVVGQRVRVPLGGKGRLVKGFVVGLDRGPWDDTLRPIDSVVDDAAFVTPDLIDVAREISVHYACPLGVAMKAVTPEAVRRRSGLVAVRYARLTRPMEEVLASGRRLSAKREALLAVLAEAREPIPVDCLLEDAGASAAILRALAKEGSVEIITRKEIRAEPPPDTLRSEPEFALNDEQQAALNAVNAKIDAGCFSVTLLFGVSGSGKTEVYIRAMQRVVAAGRQAILLVPEIVLTTQLVGRLAPRFSDVAINHSGLTDAQRSVLWQQIAAGDKRVIIGTRSAVFAPCPNLGLICVDEEQETGYKNLQAPRFNVRDVAIIRAQRLGIPVVLGSATPSVEAWYHSEHRSEYQRVVLRRRVLNRPMPKVRIVDMHDEFAERRRVVVLSLLMERLLSQTLERGEQALILMNRRGFADKLYCPACRVRITCPNCSVGLVAHSATGTSICHYCRASIPTPTRCPNVTCGEELLHTGAGTQKVEEVLAERFPKARIRRVDSDTMRHRDQYQRIVDDFEAREIDVLVGTQMIAKGLDFPFVSFVGVVHADAVAMAGDFRAQERLFQLITQVAGRAGRADAPGQVVVQTMTPTLPALTYALAHDYEAFVADELPVRRKVGLPPFRRIARIVLAHSREETVRREAEALYGRICEMISAGSFEHADVLGPNSCLLSRLRGKYRYDLLVRTPNASSLRRLLAQLDKANAFRTKAESTMIDVDPVSLA